MAKVTVFDTAWTAVTEDQWLAAGRMGNPKGMRGQTHPVHRGRSI